VLACAYTKGSSLVFSPGTVSRCKNWANWPPNFRSCTSAGPFPYNPLHQFGKHCATDEHPHSAHVFGAENPNATSPNLLLTHFRNGFFLAVHLRSVAIYALVDIGFNYAIHTRCVMNASARLLFFVFSLPMVGCTVTPVYDNGTLLGYEVPGATLYTQPRYSYPYRYDYGYSVPRYHDPWVNRPPPYYIPRSGNFFYRDPYVFGGPHPHPHLRDFHPPILRGDHHPHFPGGSHPHLGGGGHQHYGGGHGHQHNGGGHGHRH
jgi:hypothetical protein